MSAFTRDILIAPQVGASSPVRRLTIRWDHLLVRPYSPAGRTAGGLWLERNPKHPKIWAHVLAVSARLHAQIPTLVPGDMVIISRWDGEPINKEVPAKSRYIGHMHTVFDIAIEHVHATINPALVPLEVALDAPK